MQYSTAWLMIMNRVNNGGEKSFAEQIDDVLAGKDNRYVKDIKVCDTPQILIDAGCRQLPMLYTKEHLRNAVKEKNPSLHQHGLAVTLIKKLPKLIAEPVIIYDSISRKDSLILVTEEFDNEQSPVVVSIRPNGSGKYELQHVESNFITSVHGRDNYENQLLHALEKHKIIYINNKSQELFSVLSPQLTKGLNNLDFNIIIHQSRNIVNNKIEKKNPQAPQSDGAFLLEGKRMKKTQPNDIQAQKEKLHKEIEEMAESYTDSPEKLAEFAAAVDPLP